VVNRRSVKSVKSVNIRLNWVMKRRRFDFFKGKKMIIRFVLTKTTSFHFMSVRLIGRNRIRFGSVRLPLKMRFGSVRLPIRLSE